MELVIVRNPDARSRLPYLMYVPLGDGLVFRVRDTWPRTSAVYCHPVGHEEWPDEPEIVERASVRSCVRRGGAIDLILDRGRENRSQIVYTKARGRDVVFWQSARTRKQARPDVRPPTARAAGLADLPVLVDTHEQYPYRFSGKPVTLVKRALPFGDYGTTVDDRLVAVAERKSLADLVSSLTSGRLRFALADLASSVPRACVVVEDRYSQIFKQDRARPSVVADGLAELQIRWPNVPIVFCETRMLAEEYVYRYLAAAAVWATTEVDALARLGAPVIDELSTAPESPEPSTAEVRRWARQAGLDVPDRGRLRPEVWLAWRTAHTGEDTQGLGSPNDAAQTNGQPPDRKPAH